VNDVTRTKSFHVDQVAEFYNVSLDLVSVLDSVIAIV